MSAPRLSTELLTPNPGKEGPDGDGWTSVRKACAAGRGPASCSEVGEGSGSRFSVLGEESAPRCCSEGMEGLFATRGARISRLVTESGVDSVDGSKIGMEFIDSFKTCLV
ncbi:hypothetical protein Dimus_012018 [Dionaea muscipula]